MAGVGIGAVTLGSCADSYGRLRTLAFTLLGMIIFGVSSSFVQRYSLYLLMRYTIVFFCHFIMCISIMTSRCISNHNGFFYNLDFLLECALLGIFCQVSFYPVNLLGQANVEYVEIFFR